MSAPRILIVDDDDSLRDLLRLTLPADGLDIAEARDGAEALASCALETPDLVLLDWNLPESSGEQVLAALKAARPELPVIVLTAELAPRHRARARELRADVFLTKPFSPLQLLDQIERLLGRR